MKNDKLDALIMLSGDILAEINSNDISDMDTSNVKMSVKLDRSIKRIANRERRRKEYGSIYKVIRRIAVVILAVCTAMFAGVMSIKAVREAITYTFENIFVTKKDDHYKVSSADENKYNDLPDTDAIALRKEESPKQAQTTDENTNIVIVPYSDPETNMPIVVYKENPPTFILKVKEPPTSIIEIREPSKIPEGCERCVDTITQFSTQISYKRDGKKILGFSQMTIDSSGTGINSENTKTYTVMNDVFEGILVISSDGNYNFRYDDKEYAYMLTGASVDISLEEFLNTALSVCISTYDSPSR